MASRIDRRFERLAAERRAALVTYIMAGDPDPETSLALLKALPGAGADVVELGMPFTDPMADGPPVQAAGLRALKAGQTLAATLTMVAAFRTEDAETPVVLMGYFNPIYVYGVERFIRDARNAGVDGLIVVDCPPEEDDELCLPARAGGLCFVRLVTPTTDDRRLPAVLANTGGFLYYVSVTGVTGAAAPDFHSVGRAVARLKSRTSLPIAVGFGVKDAERGLDRFRGRRRGCRVRPRRSRASLARPRQGEPLHHPCGDRTCRQPLAERAIGHQIRSRDFWIDADDARRDAEDAEHETDAQSRRGRQGR